MEERISILFDVGSILFTPTPTAKECYSYIIYNNINTLCKSNCCILYQHTYLQFSGWQKNKVSPLRSNHHFQCTKCTLHCTCSYLLTNIVLVGVLAFTFAKCMLENINREYMKIQFSWFYWILKIVVDALVELIISDQELM